MLMRERKTNGRLETGDEAEITIVFCFSPSSIDEQGFSLCNNDEQTFLRLNDILQIITSSN